MVCWREWDLREPGTPAIVMLDKLVHDGWRVGRAPLEHTLDTPRVFPRPSQMSQRYYWRCLATFDKLCANGLQVLPRGKPQPYYMNVLAEYLGLLFLPWLMSRMVLRHAVSYAQIPRGALMLPRRI